MFNLSYFFTGAFSGPVIDRFGIRMTSAFGGLISSIGIVIAAFAYNVTFLIITYGIITGIQPNHVRLTSNQ